MNQSPITLTNSAYQQIKQSVLKRGNTLGLRVGIKTSGCSGLAYVLEYADVKGENDQQFIFDDFSLFVNQKSLPYLKGMALDYVVEDLNAGFKFENPNVKATCGCGESFTVDSAKTE